MRDAPREIDQTLTSNEIVECAAAGRLPEWAVAGDARRAHMTRVADLLDSWARDLSLDEEERRRWRAAGHLHDALRDEDPAKLRPRVPPSLQDLPGALLHGPAAAERLRIDGVDDGELLAAISFHTVGSAGFGRLGRALYAADFLEPGRPYLTDWRAESRGRMPADLDDVVFEIARVRMRHGLDGGRAISPRTLGFWNRLVEDRS